ncbi:MAG TPA: Sec-independent protein translocase protein TatB [Steroidobacteraceae bacterium]|jgi:sec-independent protein translocase protein TatB|nr:Sec-independent protein translocase protein TatB [Steroidobacteraceae bacterium]
MLDVGFSEILLTSAIALIVLGPERLPKVARQVGNWMGRARAMARQLSEQLEREVSAEELLKIQSNPPPRTDSTASRAGAPTHEAALDSSYTPNIGPAVGTPSVGTPEEAAPEATTGPPKTPEPTYGAPASATTPAAMHASDKYVADSKPTHE